MDILVNDDILWSQYRDRYNSPRDLRASSFTTESECLIPLPPTLSLTNIRFQAKRLRKADPEGHAKAYAEHERQDWSWKGVLRRSIYRPFQMLAMEPILVLTTLYLSLIYGILYGRMYISPHLRF